MKFSKLKDPVLDIQVELICFRSSMVHGKGSATISTQSKPSSGKNAGLNFLNQGAAVIGSNCDLISFWNFHVCVMLPSIADSL